MAQTLGKIDVHHHSLPDFYVEAIKASVDVSGAPAPVTTIDSNLSIMDKIGAATAIISLSAPGAEIAKTVDTSRALARRYNEYGASFRKSNPARLGYFAALPNINDVEGCIAEIKFALDEQKADGVTLFTSSDGRYLGHPDFKPIWKELNERHAVVFIHPTHTPSGEWTSPQLQQPIIDYPHETTRTASDLIMSGRIRECPDCKIILSHAGGTLPYLVERLEQLCTSLFQKSGVKGGPLGEQIMEDAKSFYFDTALAGTANILDTLLKWAPKDKILFGSDFPYAPDSTIEYFTKSLEDYPMGDEERRNIYQENALKLFPRLRR